MTSLLLTTERLQLRPFKKNDAVSLHTLRSDPEVMRYAGESPFADVAAAQAYIDGYSSYQKYGCGRLAVLERPSGKIIGWCGISYCPDSKEYDLGFRFFRSQWGRGYATEAGRACLDWAFQNLPTDFIVARVADQNLASIRVLEKLGMVYEAPTICGGMAAKRYVYRLKHTAQNGS